MDDDITLEPTGSTEVGSNEPDLPVGPETPSTPLPPWQPPAPPPTEPSAAGGHRAPRRRWPLVVSALLVVALLSGGATYFVTRGGGTEAPDRASSLSLRQATGSAPLSTTAQMIKRVLPSVVNVRVTEVSVDPFGGTQTGKAEGSGVILSKDGVIVTNAHVVSGASSVNVLFTNGHASLTGTVLGIDRTHDLAVIKVNATDLTPITVGHSGTLQLGDQAVAIGFPLGLGPTVTEGIVSGTNRTIDVQGPNGVEHLVGLLQTDAAINPGNSGGALVDASGRLIGINTAGASSAENVGFAIAIDSAVPIVQQLASQTPSQRAWLGVEASSVDSAAAASVLGVPTDTRGAVVAGVIPDSPAAQAGLQPNDVIVSIDGAAIAADADLTSVLATHKPGDQVELQIVSQSGTRTVTVTLGQRPGGL